MEVKQVLIVLTIVIFFFVVSYGFGVLAQVDEPPKWSNLYHKPTVATILDPVTINVTWYDNESLDTVLIWENSTGDWESHTFGS